MLILGVWDAYFESQVSYKNFGATDILYLGYLPILWGSVEPLFPEGILVNVLE